MPPMMVNDFCDTAEMPNRLDRATLYKLLGRSGEIMTEDGYKVSVWGGALHPSKNWLAWIDYYEKVVDGWTHCNYYLRIRVDDKQVFEWTVETYNPYFGAVTVYLNWHGDQLVYIYLEKHRIYGVTADTNSIIKRIELGLGGTQLYVENNVVYIVPPTRYEGHLLRYHLPDWEALPPLPEAEAIQQGLITRPDR